MALFLFGGLFSATSLLTGEVNSSSVFVASAHAPNTGNYTRTGSSVAVYTESGTFKGNYPVYLNSGKKYIDFQNTWICIQGKSRFSYAGNWYVIR